MNRFSKRLLLDVPLVVAPMAGGPSSPELVIASCEAGALGSIGAAYYTPQEIERFVERVRMGTQRPFAINLFIPGAVPEISGNQVARAVRSTEMFRQELGLPAPELTPPFEEDFDQQFETVLRLRPRVLSFVFGLLSAEYVRAAKREGLFLIGTATTSDEALALQESGVNAVTLQGYEGGGHRGIFDPAASDPAISLFSLLERCEGKLRIPRIAAGGIMSARDVAATLAQGAEAVQMGTAFLACEEAGTSEPYKKALLASRSRKTRLTRAFSGRLARSIENTFMEKLDRHPEAILPFPAQNKFTRDIRTACAKADSSDFLSLWSGTGEGQLWTGPAAALIHQLFHSK